MATADAPRGSAENSQQLKERWIERLSALVNEIRRWAVEMEWSAKEVSKAMEDSAIGNYTAPGLLLQKEFTKVLLEPIARSAPGAEGVVDLYLMPGLDDIASLYYYGGGWQLHYMSPKSPTDATHREVESKPLNKEAFREVIEEMRNNAL
jgi:hypothetical protein